MITVVFVYHYYFCCHCCKSIDLSQHWVHLLIDDFQSCNAWGKIGLVLDSVSLLVRQYVGHTHSLSASQYSPLLLPLPPPPPTSTPPIPFPTPPLHPSPRVSVGLQSASKQPPFFFGIIFFSLATNFGFHMWRLLISALFPETNIYIQCMKHWSSTLLKTTTTTLHCATFWHTFSCQMWPKQYAFDALVLSIERQRWIIIML